MKVLRQEIAKFTKFVPGGRAIGELADGRKVFAWDVLPGETAEIALTKSKKSFAEGFSTKILAPAKNRIEPRDACFLSTSPWQILDWNSELRAKENLVKESFAEEKIALEISPISSDEKQFFYRNKMEYSLYFMSARESEKPEFADFRATFSAADFARKYVNRGAEISGGKIFLAFHKRGSHGKIPILKSSIERPEIFAAAQKIVDELNARGENAWKFQSLLVRANQNGEVAAALFENGKPHPAMLNLDDELCGRKFSYSPNGFFQINLPVYARALEAIATEVGNAQKVIDMYSGVGSIGLSLARENREITLVETDDSAFRESLKNVEKLPENLRQNVRAIHAKSEDALAEIAPDATLIVDPPRAGLFPTVSEKIVENAPEKVVYLSCDPATQARDVAKILASGKYEIAAARPFNFFPRTPHIENLVVLAKVKN